MWENGLIRKLRLVSKFMTLQPGKINNCNIHIAQYLKKKGQSDHEIWLANRI